MLHLRVGCFNRGRRARWPPAAGSRTSCTGPTSRSTTRRRRRSPSRPSGLLAGGSRSGSDPVTVTASDGAGIRKVELIDTTNPLAPAVVGVEDYAQVRTGANRICDFSLPAPCPGLSRETLQAASLPAGQRSVTVRVTDTGGNIVDRGPYPVFAVTPSDRGAANGSNATETGTLSTTWTVGGTKRRTLSYGSKAGVRGRLLNSSGQPIGGGAGAAAHARPAA